MTDKPNAPATERNRDAILEVIRTEFGDRHSVLEIGSGTGQHAVYFGDALPWLVWQTSDLAENLQGISVWIDDSGLSNVRQPILLDVERPDSVRGDYDAVFSANTAHIMSTQAVRCMFNIVGRLLAPGGIFCLYGPFNRNGRYTSASNQRFDQSLRRQNPAMGIRDLEELDDMARQSALRRRRLFAMPANNSLVIWCGHGVSPIDYS